MSLTTMSVIIEGRFRLGVEITRGQTSEIDSYGETHHSSKNDKARVYRAEDLETGRPVAIKILIQPFTRADVFRSRFQRDATIMRSIDHPSIVKTIASGVTEDGQPYLAMELLQGKTLAAKIAEQGTIPPDEIAEYLHQVAAALDAAHAAGIVHRDINPEAIMIQDSVDGASQVKLLDFGLAKEPTRPGPSQAELTSKQTSLGTAAYLSPEQARGGEVDGRSDVYSLGVTLYQALTGRLPFEGETDFQILLAQINGSIPPFQEGWTDHENAREIEDVVLMALAKDPANRPETAGKLSTLFEDAVHSRPARRFRLSWPMLVVGGGVLIMAVVFVAKWLL